MAEEIELDLDLIECPAFPGLSFSIEPGRDDLALWAKDNTTGNHYTILKLVRNFGTIERPTGLPADFPGLPGRKEGRVPTTEELAAEQLLVGREVRRALDDEPTLRDHFIPGRGNLAHLNFALRGHDRDGIQLICESRQNPGTHRMTLLGFTHDGYLSLYRTISDELRQFTTLHYDVNWRLALPPNSTQIVRHPHIPHLHFYLEPEPRSGALHIVGYSRNGCELVASITREGRLQRWEGHAIEGLSYAPGTTRIEDITTQGMDRDRAEQIVNYCIILPPSGVPAARRQDQERLPIEAAKFHPAPGDWIMKTLKDGRRRYHLTSPCLRETLREPESLGATSFILGPVRQESQPTPEPELRVTTTTNRLVPLSIFGGGPAAEVVLDLEVDPSPEDFDLDLDREEEDNR